MNLESQVEELQGRIATLEAQMQVILEHLGVAGKSDDPFEARLLELIRANQKIEAIKRYREKTGLGLKEAKDAVEDLERRLG
jgi:ribosomal protein L7/L12